ncbi:hypothetical protein BH11PSE11_BH11PSE11_32210 [soil metagenome]
MKNSIKAALLSALVSPGLGHFALKRVARGMLFFVPTALAFTYILKNLLYATFQVAERIPSGAVPPDLDTITKLATGIVADAKGLDFAIWIMGICWVLSIVDSFWLGSQIDRAADA